VHTNTAGLIVEVNATEYGLMKQQAVYLAGRVRTPSRWSRHGRARTSVSPKRWPSRDVATLIRRRIPVGEGGATNQRRRLARRFSHPRFDQRDRWPAFRLPRSFSAPVIKLDTVKPMYDPLIGTLFSFRPAWASAA
jgi:hypothetical protein